MSDGNSVNPAAFGVCSSVIAVDTVFGLVLLSVWVSRLYLAPTSTLPSVLPLADLPLAFVPNQGQNDPAVQYQVQSGNSRLDFLVDGVRVSGSLEGAAVS